MESKINTPEEPSFDELISNIEQIRGEAISERLVDSLKHIGNIGIVSADMRKKMPLEGAKLSVSTIDEMVLAADLRSIYLCAGNLLQRKPDAKASKESVWQRVQSMSLFRSDSTHGTERFLRCRLLPASIEMPSYVSLSMTNYSLGRTLGNLMGRNAQYVRKQCSTEAFAKNVDSLADATRLSISRQILTCAAAAHSLGGQSQRQLSIWTKQHLDGILAGDDEVAYRDAFDNLQSTIVGLYSSDKKVSHRSRDSLVQIGENLKFISACDNVARKRFSELWRSFIGDKEVGMDEMPHFLREQFACDAVMVQRQAEAGKARDERNVAMGAKLAAKAAKLAEGRAMSEQREKSWQALQPAISTYQQAATEYNHAMQMKESTGKSLSPLSRALVNGYYTDKKVDGIDKKLASDVTRLLASLDQIDDGELVKLYNKLAEERERLLAAARQAGHNDIDLRRLMDLPSAMQYIQGNYDDLRRLVVKYWPEGEGLDRDKILWQRLFPDRDYVLPKGYFSSSVGDVATRATTGIDDTNTDRVTELQVEPVIAKETLNSEMSDAGTKLADVNTLPREAVGAFAELSFQPFKLDERAARRTGFDRIEWLREPSDISNYGLIKLMQEGAQTEVENYLERNGRKSADWSRLKTLLQTPRLFNADDAEYFRTARGGFREIPPYFIVAFTAYGKPICVAETPVTGNATYIFRDDINPGTWQEMIEELTKSEARRMGATRAFHRGSADQVRNNIINKINDLIVLK